VLVGPSVGRFAVDRLDLGRCRIPPQDVERRLVSGGLCAPAPAQARNHCDGEVCVACLSALHDSVELRVPVELCMAVELDEVCDVGDAAVPFVGVDDVLDAVDHPLVRELVLGEAVLQDLCLLVAPSRESGLDQADRGKHTILRPSSRVGAHLYRSVRRISDLRRYARRYG
jgi:hypothetical protein